MKISLDELKELRPCDSGLDWFTSNKLFDIDIPLGSIIRVSNREEFNNIKWLLNSSKFIYNNSTIFDYIKRVELYMISDIIKSIEYSRIDHPMFGSIYRILNTNIGDVNSGKKEYAIIKDENIYYQLNINNNGTAYTYITINDKYFVSSTISSNNSRDYTYNEFGDCLTNILYDNNTGDIISKEINEYDSLRRCISKYGIDKECENIESTIFYKDTDIIVERNNKYIQLDLYIEQIIKDREENGISICCTPLCSEETQVEEGEIEHNISTIKILKF